MNFSSHIREELKIFGVKVLLNEDGKTILNHQQKIRCLELSGNAGQFVSRECPERARESCRGLVPKKYFYWWVNLVEENEYVNFAAL
jgi:hypothetical protein